MARLPRHAACAFLAAGLAAACAAVPDDTPTFHDMRAEQAAIQAVLAAGETGASRPWQGPGGARGTARLMGGLDAEGCRDVETMGPGGAITDTWCPTPHGFWVHPDELFYRNATGRETYGGAARSGTTPPAGGAETDLRDDRPEQIDCLRLLNDERRLVDDNRDGAARAARRAYHRCLHQSR
ncbi:MAG: hypothetical protein COW30_18245 [Rhodospirillales bacterium CG15_BIG_FIL_POST_REV_8_21_14_020_66_15]|nr:MAG: hypothetical protein COW30_18245 [Rhodospirillales bacterium CG15_BIG_FIL_POST_REV_8_21_14_020_66_15]